ncbi:MAG: DUF819 family protein [Saprospiraceae bacterium]|nr:DUF819 family protein [Saprospiraceae bacterium]MDP4997480.1 DUF819 family protein [Saprospiraceae bacterium]
MELVFPLQLLLLLGFPLLAQTRLQNPWLSPIVMAYAGGLLSGLLFPGAISAGLATPLTELSILIAIPLLLFGTQLQQLRTQTGKTLLAFGLCAVSGLLVAFAAGVFYRDQVPDSSRIAAMLTGLYTGGTPNMQAIGMGLGVPDATIILVNAADVATGGLYLLFLTSIGPWFFGKLLPVLPPVSGQSGGLPSEKIRFADAAKALLLSLVLLGLSLGTVFLIWGNLSRSTWIILLLTTLSLAASRIPKVQSWQGTYPLATYFLLVFSFALGTLADFATILDTGIPVLIFTFVVMIGTILVHLLLSRFAKIDRDTFMITSTAALFGPAFIGQVASVLKNPGIVAQGMVTGLLGYAVGNYLGFLLYGLLEW